MGTLKDRARPPYAPERKYRRFDLRCPVRVKFPSGDAIAQVEAISKNVSIGGLLLECSSMIPPRRPVSFVMTVEGDQLPRPIQLRGDGEVVRIEPRKGGSRVHSCGGVQTSHVMDGGARLGSRGLRAKWGGPRVGPWARLLARSLILKYLV